MTVGAGGGRARALVREGRTYPGWVEGNPRRLERRAGAAAGAAGAGSALLAAGTLHALVPSIPYPPVVVAEALVHATPGRVATFFIELLGHVALPLSLVATAVGMVAVSALLGLALGPLSRRLPGGTPTAAALLGLPLLVAAVATSAAASATLLPVFALAAWMTARTFRRLSEPRVPEVAGVADAGRRVVLRTAWMGGAGLFLGWVGLGAIGVGRRPDPGREALRVEDLARVRPPGPAPGDAAFTSVDGLAPRLTPLADFYVVDESILDPDVDPETWRLRVGGSVQRPLELTHDQLLAFPVVEQYATLECISNPVGGDLISTARWAGVRLADLLERAGVREGAVEVVARAIGGYSDSIPMRDALRPETLVAVGMNGHVLPREHGFPARLLVPGRYGMKQPKWLESLEVVAEPYQGYWEKRGWSKAGMVRTMSRIDATDPSTAAGSVTVAGVAFAGDRGISEVEVSTDGGRTWEPAELETALSGLSWRRWRYVFRPAEGRETLVRVRATDGEGRVQVQTPAAPHPSGSSGYDGVTIDG